MNMSFEEKSAWISLFCTLGIFGNYFINLLGFSGLPAEQAKGEALELLTASIIMIVVLEAALHTLLAISNRKGAEMGADERDKLIAYRANEWGYWVLGITVVMTIGRLILVDLSPDFNRNGLPMGLESSFPFATAHLLMFGFILSEVVRFAAQVVLYRKEV